MKKVIYAPEIRQGIETETKTHIIIGTKPLKKAESQAAS